MVALVLLVGVDVGRCRAQLLIEVVHEPLHPAVILPRVLLRLLHLILVHPQQGRGVVPVQIQRRGRLGKFRCRHSMFSAALVSPFATFQQHQPASSAVSASCHTL